MILISPLYEIIISLFCAIPVRFIITISKLDWNDNAAGAVKPGGWNKYEILAVEHRIWTAINGKLCVAIEDPQGELSGKIAFQIHSGSPQTVHYRNPKLTHNPKIKLAGLSEKKLVAELRKVVEPKTKSSSR